MRKLSKETTLLNNGHKLRNIILAKHKQAIITNNASIS